MRTVLVATSLAFTLGAGCAGEPAGPEPAPDPGPRETEPDPVGAAIAAALDELAEGDPDVAVLAHEIRQPGTATPRTPPSVESCQAIEDALWAACASVDASCWVQATFYWAHDIPRCSARLEIEDDYQDDAFSRVYVLDLAGASRVNPAPTCGDGELDPDRGETCDDGNLEAWDGCDPNCQEEPFTGCESVIQQEFSADDIAWIDATRWSSPRAHLMVHDEARAFGAVDAALCARAQVAAEDVCARLATDMPFVSWCAPEVHLTAPARCDVRLRVQFLSPSPGDGVFTTALQGVLAFSIE